VDNIWIGLIGSLLALDTTIVFQFLVSQPLVTASILGWLMGDLQLGIQVGFYLQLLWLRNIPVGGAVVPEGNVAAIVTTTLVLRYNMDMAYINSVIVLGVIYGIGLSYIGGELVVFYRKLNVNFLKWTLNGLAKGRSDRLSLAPFASLMVHFILMFLLIYTGIGLGDILFARIPILPVFWDEYFRYGLIAILGIGVGLVISLYKQKDDRLLLAIGFLLGGIVFLLK
jgi:mannose/fructose/N-acetylgalactosamine-specific phosphotransferase system component IIC